MPNDKEYPGLIEYLRGLGQCEAEIEKIMARVRQYDF